MVRLIIILLLVEYFLMEVPGSGASSSRLVNLNGFLNSEELWSDRCNIKRRMLSTITQQNFQLPDIPVVYENDISNLDGYDEARMLASRSYLLNYHFDQLVKLTSSNSYSQGEVKMSLGEYILHHVDSTNISKIDFSPANESLYLFGGNYDGIWTKMSKAYSSPPCKYCDKAGVETFGIGGHGSGVSFHVHGPGFSEPLVGGKRWFLFPPHLSQAAYKFGDYGPNTTTLAWLRSQYQSMMQAIQPPSPLHGEHNSSDSSGVCGLESSPSKDALRSLGLQLQECSLRPGQIIYFPAMWPHATLNTDGYNAFVSVFIDTQLMRD